MKAVKVRMLQAVTYGSGRAWLPGTVQSVAPALARAMVDAGEAVYIVRPMRDTTVAVASHPMRRR